MRIPKQRATWLGTTYVNDVIDNFVRKYKPSEIQIYHDHNSSRPLSIPLRFFPFRLHVAIFFLHLHHVAISQPSSTLHASFSYFLMQNVQGLGRDLPRRGAFQMVLMVSRVRQGTISVDWYFFLQSEYMYDGTNIIVHINIFSHYITYVIIEGTIIGW